MIFGRVYLFYLQRIRGNAKQRPDQGTNQAPNKSPNESTPPKLRHCARHSDYKTFVQESYEASDNRLAAVSTSPTARSVSFTNDYTDGGTSDYTVIGVVDGKLVRRTSDRMFIMM